MSNNQTTEEARAPQTEGTHVALMDETLLTTAEDRAFWLGCATGDKATWGEPPSFAPGIVAKLVQDVETLRVLADDRRNAIDALTEMKLNGLTIDNEGCNIDVSGWWAGMMARLVHQFFVESKGINFVTQTLMHETEGPFEITLQRKWGESPADLFFKARLELEALRAQTLDVFQSEVRAWAEQTYPGRNHDTIQAHFAEEAIEFVGIGRMKAAIERAEAKLHQRMTSTDAWEPVRVPEEGADCGLLLLSWFSLHHNSLMEQMQAKMQINRGRKWADDGRGYMTHVEEGEQNV